MPKKNYNPSINIEGLKEEQSLFVLRRSELPQDELITELGMLSSHAFDESELPGMSMNLLGGHFKTNDVVFRPFGTAAKRWYGNIVIYLSDFLQQYSILPDNYITVFFPVEKLFHTEIPFFAIDNIEGQKLFKALKYDKEVRGDHIYSKKGAQCKVIHAPTNLNYWHVELSIIDPSEKEITGKQRPTAREKIAAYIIEAIFIVNGKAFMVDLDVSAIKREKYILN